MNKFTQLQPRRRAEQKGRTRQRLLEHARELFTAQGFERTTLRGVARRAGVAVGTIFVHFPDKEALLFAALADQLDATLRKALAKLPPEGLRARLRHVLGALFRSYAATPALSRVLVSHTLFSTGATRERTRAHADAFVGLLASWCAEPGALRKGLAPEAAAEAVFAAYLVALVEGLGEERPDPRRQLATVERLLTPWLAVPSSTRGAR